MTSAHPTGTIETALAHAERLLRSNPRLAGEQASLELQEAKLVSPARMEQLEYAVIRPPRVC